MSKLTAGAGEQTATSDEALMEAYAHRGDSAAFEQLTAVKSFDKAIELQQSFAKEAYETFVAQMTKFNELYVATAKEAYKPFESSFAAFGIKPITK